MDWSLLGCTFRGHMTYAPDEPAVRDQLRAESAGQESWRCLRCATFVPGKPALRGPAAAAPRVLRDAELRSALILRLFAVERFVRAIVLGVIAYEVWRLKYARSSMEQAFDHAVPVVGSLLRGFGYNVNHSRLVGFIQHAFTLNQRTLTWLALALVAYTIIEIAESTSLWLLRRWGEYFAMVATSAFIPYEIYELASKITTLRLLAFAINVLLVVYLIFTKRLLGVRGGKKAYDARLRSESVMDGAIDAAGQAAQEPASGAGPGQG